jgi:hypothetical protein
MELYQWQGSLAVLIDVGPLEAAICYSENTVVKITLKEPEAAEASSQNRRAAAGPDQPSNEGDDTPVQHVSAAWDPPSNATGESADIVVTGFQEDLTVTVVVGTWSGLDLRRACCQQWGIPLKSTNMGVYRWQGALAPLADKDGLDGAMSYVNGTTSVHVICRNFRTSGGTPERRRKQRLQLSNKGYNTGDCFIAAVLKYTCLLSQPTALEIANLRAEARLPESGSATGGHMVQLLRYLSCCCIMVQAGRESAIVLNAEAGTSRCITMVMQGNRHVEPAIMHDTVQLRSLDEVINQLQVCGIQVHLPTSGPSHGLADAISILDDDERLPAERSADHAPKLARSRPHALPAPASKPTDSLLATWPPVGCFDDMNRTCALSSTWATPP